MFKFATNKFSHSNNNNNTSNNSNTNNNATSNTNALKHHSDHHDSSSSSSRRRFQIQKDLFSFNKIADKGFPSKPSAMDYDKKLKLLAIGTRNGDIRIYGEPYTQHQQLSCYQDVHPFPIQRLLFVQGQYQLITLSERSYRNDMTNKGESHLFLILWQIPNLANQIESATLSSSNGNTVNPSSPNTNSFQSSNLVEKIKEYQLDPKIVNNTRLSALTLLNDNSHLFIGFETGDVYVFNVSSFQLVPGVINKDYIIKNIPNDLSNKKLTQLGAVESICHHPRQLTKLLIAYQRGLWIIFDFIKNQIDQINQTQQQLESAVFYQQGECVATSHSDGSFILWDLTSTTQSSSSNVDQPTSCSSSSPPNIVYGPYPCKSVNKCFVKTCKNDQPYVIFSGGCPRVNYSDKITISVIQGENSHVCFDFTSKIIDFFTIDKPSVDKQPQSPGSSQNAAAVIYDNPQALLVLLEEEFVAIDLVTENWPQFKLPYLYSVHSSAIICTHYVNGISKQFYERLKHFGSLCQDPSETYSDRDWPINSGNNVSGGLATLGQQTERRDLLLTGHEDGSIRFWDVTHMSMTLIYRLKTCDYFQTDSTPLDDQPADSANGNDVDNWPPFRKVGTFDPYSDDPKLGIQKIFLCPQREILVIAGTAGQVLIMCLNDQSRDLPYNQIQAHKINIIGVSPEVESHFVWKGHEPLATRGRFNNQISQGSLKILPGYQLHSLIQLYPPATVSALALNTDWQLVAMGTSHGFALFDYLQSKDLLIRCTLDPVMLLSTSANDSGNGGTTISRRKSLKKSLRESFRKLRRGRSQKPNPNKKNVNNDPLKPTNTINEDGLDDGLHKPIERQVESREFKPMDDIPPSVIRYMYFVRTYITSSQQQTNSLWVGTNTGIIYIYALQFLLNASNVQSQQQFNPRLPAPSSTTIRSNQSINCLLAKEMRLKHRAPVVHIQVIDQNMHPLPVDTVYSNGDQSNGGNMNSGDQHHQSTPNHKVIICSEEQFKVFQLPALKPVCKFKLTAVEGARVRRIGYNCYISKNDPKYSEYCLSCLSNLGDLSVYSLPQLKRQVQIQCMKQQDINAITSFVFTKQGQAFYLQSPSEFVHISMSARDSPHLIQLSLLNQTNRQIKENSNSSKPNTLSKQSPDSSNTNNLSNTSQSNQKKQPQQNTPTTEISPKQQLPGQTPTSASSTSASVNSTPSVNNSQLNSPKSTPSTSAPVPAPRTTIASTNSTPSSQIKEDSNNYRNLNNDETKLKANESNLQQNQQQQQQQQQQLKIDNLNETTQSISKSNDNLNMIKKLDNNEIDDQLASSFLLSMSGMSSPQSKQNSNKLNNDMDKSSYKPDVANSSLITNSGASSSSQSALLLNQSNISSITLNNQIGVNMTCSLANGVNSSMFTGQSDSFNVSSSGYNGSSTCVGNNATINLSMDSVVDRFSDEYNEVSTKKIPTSIDENSSTTNSDSLLNESEVANDLNNKLNLNGSVKCNGVNGHSNTATNNGHRNGATNLIFENEDIKINGQQHSTKNGHAVNDNEEETNTKNDIAPRKASSPVIKLNGNHQNGHGRSNKIEQVTKRIENGNKLEYRETAID